MNAIQMLQARAGQRVHERFYGASFIWKNVAYPCTHADVTKNPPLMEGGFSPNTTVLISLDGAVFGSDAPPKKGDLCFLQTAPEQAKVFSLQVETVMSSVGDVVWKALCVDASQNG